MTQPTKPPLKPSERIKEIASLLPEKLMPIYMERVTTAVLQYLDEREASAHPVAAELAEVVRRMTNLETANAVAFVVGDGSDWGPEMETVQIEPARDRCVDTCSYPVELNGLCRKCGNHMRHDPALSAHPAPVSPPGERNGAFVRYRRTQVAEMRAYLPNEQLSQRVSVTAADLENGSPKAGDMIARNPANYDDQWLVAGAYFATNFEPIPGEDKRLYGLTADCLREIAIGLERNLDATVAKLAASEARCNQLTGELAECMSRADCDSSNVRVLIDLKMVTA
jgi:hypothetical protein